MCKTKVRIAIRAFTAVLAVICSGSVGCRAPLPDDGTGTEDLDTSNVAPGGGCAENSWDQFDNSSSPFLGGEQEVKVEVSFSSCFHCSSCLSFAMELKNILDKQEYKNSVRVYYHHYPLTSYPDSWDIHHAAVAIANQSMEKFWAFHDEIFARENIDDRMTTEEVVQYAQNVLELDMEQFNSDSESDATADFVLQEIEQADEQGIWGTPTAWVCGTMISWDQFEVMVDLYLAGE